MSRRTARSWSPRTAFATSRFVAARYTFSSRMPPFPDGVRQLQAERTARGGVRWKVLVESLPLEKRADLRQVHRPLRVEAGLRRALVRPRNEHARRAGDCLVQRLVLGEREIRRRQRVEWRGVHRSRMTDPSSELQPGDGQGRPLLQDFDFGRASPREGAVESRSGPLRPLPRGPAPRRAAPRPGEGDPPTRGEARPAPGLRNNPPRSEPPSRSVAGARPATALSFVAFAWRDPLDPAESAEQVEAGRERARNELIRQLGRTEVELRVGEPHCGARQHDARHDERHVRVPPEPASLADLPGAAT